MMPDFEPDWASPPRESIRRSMDNKDMSRQDLVRATGLIRSTVDELLDEDVRITPRIAGLLAKAVGGTLEFWLRRELVYRQDVARLAKKGIVA